MPIACRPFLSIDAVLSYLAKCPEHKGKLYVLSDNDKYWYVFKQQRAVFTFARKHNLPEVFEYHEVKIGVA